MGSYRYSIENAVQSYDVNPKNKDDLKYKFIKKIESGNVFDKTLETALVFDYNNSGFSFKSQEEADKCYELKLLIERKCGNNYVTFFEGVFFITDGEFDDDLCTFTVKPRIKEFIFEELDVNFLETPDPVQVSVNSYQVGVRTYVNGRDFDKVVLYVAQKANPKINGVISDFFQINPVNAFPLPVTNYYQYLVFCALSDIQEPIPSDLSTLNLINFRDLMNDLNVLFDVFWYIDTNFYLRIEHRTFFNNGSGIDLRDAQYEKYMLGTSKYSYDSKDIVKEEVWSSLNSSERTALRYIGISDNAGEKNKKEYSTTKISTDYEYLIKIGGISQDGLFLFATDGAGVAVAPVDPYNLSEYRLGPLTPNALVRNLHTYDRPSLFGLLTTINRYKYDPFGDKSGGIALDSLKPIKKQKEIGFPLCCDVELDPKKTILTEMGEGYMEEATFEAKNDFIKTTLKYRVDNCNDKDPSDIEGLDLWLNMQNAIYVGTAISQLTDMSGNGRDAVQAVGANKPVGVFVGPDLYEVYFNPNQFLTTPAFQLFPSKRGTIIVVGTFSQVGAVAPGPIAVISTENGGAGIFYDLTLNTIGEFISVSDSLLYPQSIDVNFYANKNMFSVNRYEDTRVKTIQNTVVPANNFLVIANTQPASNPVIIGDNLNVGTGQSFYLRELLVYNRSLKDYELEQISIYLTKKGLLPVSP